MENYTESISEELKQKVKKFLEIHNTPIIDYWSWREALNLHKEISDEIMINDEEYRNKFKVIIDCYSKKHKDNELTAYESQLICETNRKLESLEAKYIHNKEINDLLKQLLEKKYK